MIRAGFGLLWTYGSRVRSRGTFFIRILRSLRRIARKRVTPITRLQQTVMHKLPRRIRHRAAAEPGL